MPEMPASSSPPAFPIGETNRVLRFQSCRLVVASREWDYAREHAAGIDAHWLRRQAESPSMFNGAIHLMYESAIEGGTLQARLLRSDFKSYLYWRERGFPEARVRDAFGSALLRSTEGHVILGRQRDGNVNAGLAYLPGGFIDPRDVTRDGTVDIDGSILRELAEETGLMPGQLQMQPGYIVTFCGPLVSIARELVSPLDAEALRAKTLAHLARDTQSELVDAVIVRSTA